MMVGENIHNAFVVVFKTLQEIEKLIGKCRTELDTKKYYMPARLDLLEFYIAVSAPG